MTGLSRLPKLNQGEEAMAFWCRVVGLPEPVRNYRFHPQRKWEIDLAWVSYRIGAEIDGGLYLPGGGAHSRPANILRDIEKHNALLCLGWQVLRFTPQMVQRGKAAQELDALFRSRR